jgi:hypothetical protein
MESRGEDTKNHREEKKHLSSTLKSSWGENIFKKIEQPIPRFDTIAMNAYAGV